jgi:hypothetical protein
VRDFVGAEDAHAEKMGPKALADRTQAERVDGQRLQLRLIVPRRRRLRPRWWVKRRSGGAHHRRRVLRRREGASSESRKGELAFLLLLDVDDGKGTKLCEKMIAASNSRAVVFTVLQNSTAVKNRSYRFYRILKILKKIIKNQKKIGFNVVDV